MPPSPTRVSVPRPGGRADHHPAHEIRGQDASLESVSVHFVIETDVGPTPGMGKVQFWFAAALAVWPSTLKLTVQ